MCLDEILKFFNERHAQNYEIKIKIVQNKLNDFKFNFKLKLNSLYPLLRNFV
jgi:hypothetical protein